MSKLIKVTLGLAAATALSATAQAGCPVVKPHCVTCVVTPPPPPSCVTCDGPRTGTSTLPPLSSYFEHQARCGTTPAYRPIATRRTHPPVTTHYPSATSYSGASAYAGATSSGGTSSASSYASASAYANGTTSQASAYASASASASSGTSASAHATSYASTSQAPVVTSTYQGHQYRYEGFSGNYGGLGHNERLHPTSCPVAVHNPQAHQVTGCYKVVKQWTPPHVQRPAPHRVYYRVVRPIIYVRYPVPVCVTGPCATQQHGRSRYGS
ncbi:hypothetical protein [Algimonas arctica]|uniref:hypothetical protein n=1 Tax=Algimonas arctica TaxID=1479486 RepID=UPI0016729E69|nr:hypothetical protein [Algimonas arctica]